MQDTKSKKKQAKPVVAKENVKEKQTQQPKQKNEKPVAQPAKAPLDKKSKKIKKEDKSNNLLNPKSNIIDIEPETDKAEVEPLTKFDEFVLAETEKFKKIRRKLVSHVQLDKNLIKQAVKAIIENQNSQKQKESLLGNEDDFVYLEIILSEVPSTYSIRPVQIPLPVPIYSPEYTSRFAVISRDPQREFKDKIQDLEIPCIAKVIGYTKLSKKHPTYKDKRQLFYDYDLFFCDYKIYNLLREPTGKIFYQRKKIPFPIDCDGVPKFKKDEYKTYEEYLNSLSTYTYFIMGNGPVYTVKIARTGMSTKDIVKNVIHGVYNAAPHILKYAVDQSKIRQVSVKTYSSVSLPIYNHLTQEELEALAASKANKGKPSADSKMEEEDDE